MAATGRRNGSAGACNIVEANGISPTAPVVDRSASYEVFALPISPAMAESLSKESWIVFDDPFYALLASYNLGRFKKAWVEVRTPNREHAWSQRSAIVAEISAGTYRPERYFQLAGPYRADAGVVPLSAHGLGGGDIAGLYRLGYADLNLEAGMGGLYQLYSYEAP